jgi:hypothetical protein
MEPQGGNQGQGGAGVKQVIDLITNDDIRYLTRCLHIEFYQDRPQEDQDVFDHRVSFAIKLFLKNHHIPCEAMGLFVKENKHETGN